MRATRLVIFDVDGTLLDSRGHIVGAMQAAFEECSHPVPSGAEVSRIVGLSLATAMAVLAPDGPQEELQEAYRRAYTRLLTNKYQRAASVLFEGVDTLMTQLKNDRDTLVGLATGKSRKGLDRFMSVYDFGWVATHQSADEHLSKPHPSMIERAIEDTGISADNTVMIGDTTFDIEMARAAGVASIGVTWGHHGARELAAISDLIVDDVAGLGPAIDALTGRSA